MDDPQRGFALGALVKVEIAGSGPFHAEVAWRQGDRVGLEFVKPLAATVYKHLNNEEWDKAKDAAEGQMGNLPLRRVI